MHRSIAFLITAAMALPSTAPAHHGSEYVTLDDYDLGHAGDGHLNAGFDFERFDGADELSTQFGLFVSPLTRVGLGVDVRFAEDGRGDWVYSSVSPKVQLQLTDPHSEGRFKVGMSFGYQFAEDLSYEERTTSFEDIVVRNPKTTQQVSLADSSGSGETEEPACNPLFDLDCEPASGRTPRHTGSHAPVVTGSKTSTVATGGGTETKRVETTSTTRRGVSSHQGIHDHDSRQWFGRLIVETGIGKTKLVVNLINTLPDGDRAFWGYGIGARRPLAEKLAVGLEFVGDFDSAGEHEAVGSLHYRVLENTTARLGVGVGLTEESPDLTLRTGLVWRF